MFDLSWSEILVIGTAAIIFIGPKELPGALRTLGQWAAKARSLAREFQTSVDDMIRESELDKIKTEVDKLGSADLQRHIEKHIDPDGEINKALNAPGFSTDTFPLGPATPPQAPPPAESRTPPGMTGSGVTADAAESKPVDAPAPDAPHKPAA